MSVPVDRRDPASRTREHDHDWAPTAFRMLSLVAALGLAATALALILSQKATIDNISSALYARCQAREQYDAAQNQARLAQVELYRHQIAIEAGNKFIDDTLRRQRVQAYQSTIEALVAVDSKSVPAGCQRFLR